MKTNGMRIVQTLFCAAALFFGIAATVSAEEMPEPEQAAQTAEETDELKIVSQPYTVSALYPEEVRMHVEVNHPELVKSYKWEMSDGMHVFELNGSSASTDTLVIPATEWSMGDLIFNCIITDVNDNRIYTEDINFSIANPHEVIPVLYVSEYALLAGESLDLEKVNLGSGTIRFEDVNNIAFDHVQLTNASACVFDDTFRPSTGVYYEARYQEAGEYYFHMNGENLIENSYFDPAYNAGGVALTAHFNRDEYSDHPTLVFDGEGSLTAVGGQRIISTDATVEIRNELNTEPYEDRYSDGLWAWEVELADTAKVNLKTIGIGIETAADLIVHDGAQLTVEAVAPHISIGSTSVSAITVDGDVRLGKAKVRISCKGDPEQIVPYGRIISTFHALKSVGDIYIDGTELTIDFSADPSDEQYAYNFHAISGDYFTQSKLFITDGADVSVNGNCEEICTTNGIFAPGGITIEDNSTVRMDLNMKGSVYGLRTDEVLSVKDSTVEINALTQSEGEMNFGIYCNQAQIELNDCTQYIASRASHGPAILAGLSPEPDGPKEYEENHTALRLIVNEGTEVAVPENGEISSYGYDNGYRIMPSETVYSADDHTAAAPEMKLIGPHAYGEPVYTWAEDSSTVTAELICENDPSHTVSETVEVTSEITKEPSETEDGEITYTAVFENPAFEIQVKTETIPAEKEDVSYTVLSGDKGVYTKSSRKDLTFRFGRTPDDQKTFGLFTGIQVDGKDVDQKFYTAAEGSVIITLKAEYLETLQTGKHTLTAVFEDGSAMASFTVQASPAPDTSDQNRSGLWLGLLGLSMISAIGIIVFRRKSDN